MSYTSNYLANTSQSFLSGSANSLIYGVSGTQIIQLYGTTDAILNENHQLQASSSDYPIETGATITDHIYIKPKGLTITAYVSSILIQEYSTMSSNARDTEAFARFVYLQASRTLLSVVTTLYTYDNMHITSLTSPKDSGVGNNNAVFNITLREILLTQTATTSNTSGIAQNRTATQNNGSQQSISTNNVSLLSKL